MGGTAGRFKEGSDGEDPRLTRENFTRVAEFKGVPFASVTMYTSGTKHLLYFYSARGRLLRVLALDDIRARPDR